MFRKLTSPSIVQHGKRQICRLEHQRRREHTATAVDINKIPLTDPVPGFERLSYIDPKSLERFDSKITVLDNGLRVATEPNFGEYCTLGIAIDAGSRYEIHYPPGTSNFVEKLAFSSTENFPSKDQIFGILEHKGALIDCQSTRDTFLYASSCHVSSVEDIVQIIADGVLRPRITNEEIDICRQIIMYDNENMYRTPECEPLLMDWIHQAAFKGNTLGLSKFCRNENVNDVEREHVFSYLSQYYTPERMVLAGVGVDHEFLVAAGRKYFERMPSSWSKDTSVLLPKALPIDESIAQYTGGEVRVSRDLSKMALGPTPFPNLAHAVIGFESCSLKHNDFVPFCVLQSLMGGGGSFSAGGPGKGMYTRLYCDVLNHHHWMYNATAYNHSYNDGGLFCIRGSAPPNRIGDAVKVILQEFFRLTEGVRKDELERAKTQLKSQLMMNLEMRPVMFEDLARQIIVHGLRKNPQEYVDRIDRVNNEDIIRIAEKMLVTKPSIAGYGELKKLPQFDVLDTAVAQRTVKDL